MDFTAHIRESDGMEQSVTEHCRNVAALAESYGESVGLGKLARLQGIFHDAGKLNRDFYAYIHGDSRFHRGEIDHCYAGAKYLCAFSDRHFPDQEMPYRTSRLIARTILSHHGLHDWLTESGETTSESATPRWNAMRRSSRIWMRCLRKWDIRKHH